MPVRGAKSTKFMRKAPLQARSRRTVESILTAGAYILAERGIEGFTTNHVAERAGVNIASLYQYFPNKQAILEALQARHVGRPEEADEDWRTRFKAMSLRAVLEALVDGALGEHAQNSGMHRVLLDALPRRARAKGHEEKRMALLADLLLAKARRSEHSEMMLFVARHALLGAIHEAVCERPAWLKHSAFREELVRLLEAYLKSDPHGYGA